MNLDELKKKFRHKTKADLADIDLALQAVPFLVRKIESLESELSEYEKRYEHLSSQLNRPRSLSCKGEKDDVKWEAELDEKKNRIIIKFAGEINHKIAKQASNNIYPILSNIRKGCNVINDISGLSGVNKRVMFHFRKIFYTLDMMGVERVIYIPPPGKTTILSAFRKASDNLGYQVITADSVDSAKTMIEKGEQFLKV